MTKRVDGAVRGRPPGRPALPEGQKRVRVDLRMLPGRFTLAASALCLLAGGYLAGRGGTADAAAPTLRAEVHFSPHGGCTAAVAGLIGDAKKTVRVQAYGFTSAPIVAALKAAKARGVDVQVILDRSDVEKREAAELAAAGVAVFFDLAHPIAHNKVTIVDGDAVETGSFNYTRAAEKNAENCLILRGDASLANAYSENFNRHRAHSRAEH